MTPASAPPALVFVPGLDGTALMFYRQIPLAAERFRPMGFPLPNDAALDMDDLVAALATFLDREAGPEVVLCGESFGGALSLSFALAYPDRLRGLVILNSFPVIRERWKLYLGPLALRLLPWGAMPIVRRFTEARLHSPHARPEDLREFRERSKRIGKAGYLRRLEILRRYDIRDRLGALRPPTLFLAGDRDRLLPAVSEAQYMAERVPRGKAVVLRGYGHICMINHDFDLMDYIGPWFERELRAPGRSVDSTS